MMLKRFLFLFVFFQIACGQSFAQNVFDVDYVGPGREFYNDVIIKDNVLFAPSAIYAMGEIVLENHGVLQTDVFVRDMCTLRVENSGIVDSRFLLGDDSKIIQIISEENTLNHIDFGADYTVQIRSSDSLGLADVVDTVYDANKIVIENSVLNLNRMPDKADVNVEFGENVVLVIDGKYDYCNEPLLENVSGGYAVRFLSENQDVMYSDFGYITDGKLFVERVRETDYEKIFDNDTGVFLNNLRLEKPDSLLLKKMDSATRFDELTDIMNMSVLFNPDVLLRPLKTINAYDMMGKRVSENGAGVFGEMMFSDDFDLQGAGVNAKLSVFDSVSLSIGGRIGKIEYSSEYDEFDADVYTVWGGANYDVLDWLFVRANAAYSVAKYDVKSAVYDGVIISNPRSEFGFVSMDVGGKYAFDDGVHVSGIVGGAYEFYSVLDTDCDATDVIVRTGADVGYKFSMMGISYDYSVRGMIYANGVKTASGRVDVWSELDGMGGFIDLGVLYNDDVLSYTMSANISLAF